MKKLAKIVITFLFAATTTVSFSFDKGLAARYDKLFSNVQGRRIPKELNIMSPEMFVEKCRQDKDLFVVDIRTPAETEIFSLSLSNSLKIPVADLFKAQNLEKLPKDRPIALICSSGIRSAAALMGMKSIGFSRVSIVKGGFRDLSSYLEPKEANKHLKD